MKPLLAIAVFFACGAALAEQELPVYPGTVHTRIGNDLVISGEYYRIAYFTTPDPMKKVARYFNDEWTRQGYPTTLDGNFTDEGVVSAFYTREGLVRSVVLTLHEGKTVGFSVLKDLWVTKPVPPSPALVTLEGALMAQDLASRDDPGAAQNRSLLVETDLTTARDQLHQKLQAAGYALVRETGTKAQGRSQRVLEYSRGKEQLVAVVAEVDPTLTAVTQTWIGSDRPDAFPNNLAVQKSKKAHEAAQAKVKP